MQNSGKDLCVRVIIWARYKNAIKKAVAKKHVRCIKLVENMNNIIYLMHIIIITIYLITIK